MGAEVVTYWLRIDTFTGRVRELRFSSLTLLIGFIQTGVRIRAIGHQHPGQLVRWE